LQADIHRICIAVVRSFPVEYELFHNAINLIDELCWKQEFRHSLLLPPNEEIVVQGHKFVAEMNGIDVGNKNRQINFFIHYCHHFARVDVDLFFFVMLASWFGPGVLATIVHEAYRRMKDEVNRK
jgi:hypothetical protein